MTACASIACAHCPDPGYCCRSFPIVREGLPMMDGTYPTAEAADAALAENPRPHMDGTTRQLPFKAVEVDGFGIWRFTCTKLGPDGRCTIYSSRPALCSDFTPGIHHFCKITEQAYEAYRADKSTT